MRCGLVVSNAWLKQRHTHPKLYFSVSIGFYGFKIYNKKHLFK